jgi:hypothetical protein
MAELLSAVLGALMATVGGYFAVREITKWQTRNTIAAALSAEYMARYSAPEFMEIRDVVDSCLTGMRDLTLEQRVERFRRICRRDDPESVRMYNRLHAVSMLFAEMGVGFQRGLIDVEGLAIFDRILPHYWWELSPYIAACHLSHGFPVDATRPLADQPLVFFSKFAYAYNQMVARGIAREPVTPPQPRLRPDGRSDRQSE